MREDAGGLWREMPELFGMGITSLARDDDGNVWLGSGSKGLLRVRESSFGLVPAPKSGVNMAGRAVAADGHGGLWLGSACGGLRHWRHDGDVRVVPIQEAAGNDCVTSLALDREGTIWAGMVEGVLVRIADGRPQRVAKWSSVEALNVWAYGDGRHLVATGHSTFEIGIDREGRVARQRRIEALDGVRVNSIVPSVRGGHWFSGDRGVWRMVGGRAVERWTPREGLSSRFARAVYEDAATATLWVGTYGGGLNRIRGGKVDRYDSGNGLFDDTVSCILPDDAGRLWLGGNRGITLLPAPGAAGDMIESVGYAASDGLIPAEINGGHSTPCHRDERGRLWFSLVEGFAVLDPSKFSDVRLAPLRPRIEQVAVAGRLQRIDDASLVLEPFARSLEIHYTAINLTRPQETRFRFRLRGFDRDWVDAGQNRSILYPSVPWGNHVFEVQARTLGGPWSPMPASLSIHNPRPWYLRPWILVLATALVLLAVLGGTQFSANQGGWRRGERVD
jgi:hypothetical protein